MSASEHDDEQPAQRHLRARFGLAPPRHFQYPAILLLLAEEPRHGYRLVDAMLQMGFGPIDRPTVYRTLADLEADGLLHSWAATPTAGSQRHVYGVTDAGRERLAGWMAILESERDSLENVLVRFDKISRGSAG